MSGAVAVLVTMINPVAIEYAPGELRHYAAGQRYHVGADVAVNLIESGNAAVVKVEAYAIDDGTPVDDDGVDAVAFNLDAALAERTARLIAEGAIASAESEP